uniref:proton-translocating NAD(P)(+) transhydrogenase n=1 Tax=Otus sunia TaxID=257818 RepID=A0A8C8B159_9STRI
MSYFWHGYSNVFSSKGVTISLQCYLFTCYRYKSVVLASNHFGRDFTGQITAAGQVSSVKMLIIGGGIAGLAAAGAAKAMGVTSPALEQLKFPGAEPLEGYYSNPVLFAKQCKEVDIDISTALFPGKILLITTGEPGFCGWVVFFRILAAFTRTPCSRYVHSPGVVNAGYKDLPSGMATQASSLYSNNILKLLKLFLLREYFCFEQKDDLDYGAINHVIRGILVMKVRFTAFKTPFQGLAGILGLMFLSPNPSFIQIVTRFVLAWNSGYHTTQGVTPGLHLPLIPEIVFIIAKCTVCCFLLLYASLSQFLLCLSLNYWFSVLLPIFIFFPFLLPIPLQRVKPEVQQCYMLTFSFVFQRMYFGSVVCCAGVLAGLSSQNTSGFGNALGVWLGSLKSSPEVLVQMSMAMALGRRILYLILWRSVETLQG